MATKTVEHPGLSGRSPNFAYRPNTTLGRSGLVAEPADRLADGVRQLDALLLVLTSYTDGDSLALDVVNDSIRHTVLTLASRLATEVHELHEEVALTSWAARQRKGADHAG